MRAAIQIPPSSAEVSAEFDRLNALLSNSAISIEEYVRLYAVRHAMDWMLGRCAKSPSDEAMSINVMKMLGEQLEKMRQDQQSSQC